MGREPAALGWPAARVAGHLAIRAEDAHQADSTQEEEKEMFS